jgi:ribonuclease E
MSRSALLAAVVALALAAGGAQAQLLALAADPLYAPIVQVVSAAARLPRSLPARAPTAALAKPSAAAASPPPRQCANRLCPAASPQATTKGLICISDPAVVDGSFDPTKCAGLISLLEEIKAGTPPTGACGAECQPIFDTLTQPCRDALVGGLSAADNANGAAFSSFFATCEAAVTGAGAGAQVEAPVAEAVAAAPAAAPVAAAVEEAVAPVAAAVEEAAAPAAAVVAEAASGVGRAAASAAAALLAAALL